VEGFPIFSLKFSQSGIVFCYFFGNFCLVGEGVLSLSSQCVPFFSPNSDFLILILKVI